MGPTLPAKFELGSQVPKLKVPSEGPTIGPLRREPITGKALPFSNLEQYFNERDQDLVRENAQAVLKGAGKGALGALKKGRVTWGGIGGGALQGATKERAKLELKRVAKGILGEGKKANAYDLESLRMLERANQLRKIPHGFRREIDDLEYKYLIDSFRERQRYIRAMNRSEGGK